MPARESVQLARDDLIRHVGIKPQAWVFMAFLFSVPMSILFFMVGESIQWGATGAIMGIFIGAVPAGSLCPECGAYVEHP